MIKMADNIQHSTIIISHNRLQEFTTLLEKLNEKASKFDLQPIKILNQYDVDYVIQFTEDEFKSTCELVKATKADYSRKSDMVKCTHFELEYPILKIGDWSVIGKVENISARKNLLFSVTDNVDDKVMLANYAVHDIQCDHCQLKRNRLESFVVKNNATGEYKEVGTSCLEDYTGIDPAKALFLTKMFSSVQQSTEDMDHYAGGANAISTLDFLRNVVFISQEYGFVSSAKARDTGVMPTYQAAIQMDSLFRYSDTALDKYNHSFEQCTTVANKVIQYYADSEVLEKEEGEALSPNIFMHNVSALLKEESIALEPKYLAFAAAAVPRYFRTLEEATKKAEIGGSFLGNKKDKFKTALQFVKITPYKGHYGVVYMLDFRDNQNNKVTWFTANKPDEFSADSLNTYVECAFTIRAHSTYKDIKQTQQTQVIRLKILDHLTEPEFKGYDQAGKIEKKAKKKPKLT